MNLPTFIPLRSLFAILKVQLTSQGSFLHNFAILGSGTFLAQAIPVLVSPILTRIYSPEDFAMLALFMAMVGTFTPIVCGKYEVALVTPKSHIHAKHLLGIAIYCCIGISLFLTIIFALWGQDILGLLKAQQLGRWFFSVPIALLFTGLFTAANYWANRNREYSLMSKARITRSVLTALTGILVGLLGAGFAGLLAGFIIGLGTATIFIVFHDRSVLSQRVLKWTKAKRILLYRYRNYPLYNATSGLLNGITLSMPVFFLSHYFSETIVGNYALVMRVSLAPVAFVSASVSQINLKKVVDLINSNISPIRYLIKLTLLLFVIIILPVAIIIIWGQNLFCFLFGTQWMNAGKYAAIMMPGLAMQFIASTLSSTLNATQDNRLLAAWQFISFVSTFIVLCYFSNHGGINTLLYVLMLNMIILYFLYLCIIFFAAFRAVKP